MNIHLDSFLSDVENRLNWDNEFIGRKNDFLIQEVVKWRERAMSSEFSESKKVVANGQIKITSPDYFEDDEECGYCQRPIGEKHKPNCR